MKTAYLIFALLLTFTAVAQAKDIRDVAVLQSKMVLAIMKGLKAEQDLTCKTFVDENGDTSINYFMEDNRSKFRAGFLCTDGRTAVIQGNLGDGGQTATESFTLGFSN